jgi:hypothetical protein
VADAGALGVGELAAPQPCKTPAIRAITPRMAHPRCCTAELLSGSS